jgi:hypothetical protein
MIPDRTTACIDSEGMNSVFEPFFMKVGDVRNGENSFFRNLYFGRID